MMPRVVQDSDAESEASPQKPSFLRLDFGLVSDDASPSRHMDHVGKQHNEPKWFNSVGDKEMNGAETVMISSPSWSETKRAEISMESTAASPSPVCSHAPQTTSHGEAALLVTHHDARNQEYSDDEDELVLISPRKRQRRNATQGSQEGAGQSIDLADGHPSTPPIQPCGHSAFPSRASSMTLSQAVNFGLQQLAYDGVVQMSDIAPQAPRLGNDLSFTTGPSQTVEQRPSRGIDDGAHGAKFFPSLPSQTLTEAYTIINSQDDAVPLQATPEILVETNDRNSIHEHGLHEEHLQMAGTGISPSAANEAATGDLQTSGEEHMAPTLEPVALAPVKKKRGRPRKQPVTEPEPGPEGADGDTQYAQADAGIVVEKAPPHATGKKRGRKRKIRTSSPDVAYGKDEAREEDSDDARPAAMNEAGMTNPVLPEKRQEDNQMKEDVEVADGKPQNTKPDDDKENVSDAATPKPDRHHQPLKTTSPVRNGKTPFRVGLSKRARIQPLLRIVKK